MSKKGFAIPFSVFLFIAIAIFLRELVDYAALETELNSFQASGFLLLIIVVIGIIISSQSGVMAINADWDKMKKNKRGVSVISGEILTIFLGIAIGVMLLMIVASQTDQAKNLPAILSDIWAFLGFLGFLGALLFSAILYVIINVIPFGIYLILKLVDKNPPAWTKFEVISFDKVFESLDSVAEKFFKVFTSRIWRIR